ncbi:MAG: DUF721 domain-containing protein [Thermodesulfobacteriota bacterium]|nr:DUF721 domain-containing protein [Thermodesulfobacteriota bacterium]
MKRSDRPPMKRAERVGSLLKQLLGQPGIGEQITRHQAWLVWDQLVGETIAARARPLKLRRGVLEIQVDHPVWMQQLQMMKPQILEKINAKCPNAGITGLYLRQTRGGQTDRPTKTRPTPEPPPWIGIELTNAEKESIEKELTVVDNPEVKHELRKLFTRQKQLDKERRGH